MMHGTTSLKFIVNLFGNKKFDLKLLKNVCTVDTTNISSIMQPVDVGEIALICG